MTQEQHDRSIPDQQKLVRKWAEDNGVDIVQEGIDRGRDVTIEQQEPIRCAIYIRTNVAARNDAVQAQRDVTRAFIASRRGWTCVGAYEDIGHSAGTMDRPELQRLLADLEANKVECVVIQAMDRLARSPAVHDQLVAAFQRWDATLVTVCPLHFVVVGRKARGV